MSLSTYNIGFKITDIKIALNGVVNIGYLKIDVNETMLKLIFLVGLRMFDLYG